jgi:hypothetical protein
MFLISSYVQCSFFFFFLILTGGCTYIGRGFTFRALVIMNNEKVRASFYNQSNKYDWRCIGKIISLIKCVEKINEKYSKKNESIWARIETDMKSRLQMYYKIIQNFYTLSGRYNSWIYMGSV